MGEWYHIRRADARSILSRTSGFIAEAGFTHSLTPARNCTYGCIYCYVPTMRIHAGLKPEDWQRWGQFTTFKSNAAELAAESVLGDEAVYCSPLVDPYQPAETVGRVMPDLLESMIADPPRVLTIQTRGPGILRDLGLLERLSSRTQLRVSFSLTTDREDVRRWYEPHCVPLVERLRTIEALRASGIRTFATLAPLLPCNPEALARAALDATSENIIGDPLHVRRTKPRGATTRAQAAQVSKVRGFEEWHYPSFQQEVIHRIRAVVHGAGRKFAVGPEGFRWLAE